jgi:hypothetical protein
MQLDPAGSQEYRQRPMTAEQLRYLGIRQIAYLRVYMQNDKRIFMIVGADGIALGAADELENAMEMVLENGLGFVTVH